MRRRVPLAALVAAALAAATVTLVAVAVRGGAEEQQPARMCFATGSGPCVETRTLPAGEGTNDVEAIGRAEAKVAGAEAGR